MHKRAKHQHTIKMSVSIIIKLMMKVFCLLCIIKVQLLTASEANDVVADTLPNAVVETSDMATSMSTQKSWRSTNCEYLKRLKLNQKCSFNNLFIQLIERKGKGSFGQVWKVAFSRLPFEKSWRSERVAAIKFIQYSEENIYLATSEIDILMKMYQDKVEHVTRIVPELTTDTSTLRAGFGVNNTNSTKLIMIGMQCYDMDLHSYTYQNARTSNFNIHLMITNLMVCTMYISSFCCDYYSIVF